MAEIGYLENNLSTNIKFKRIPNEFKSSRLL